MSANSNKEIKAQVSNQTDALSDEELDGVAGGALILGTGGIEVSFTPS